MVIILIHFIKYNSILWKLSLLKSSSLAKVFSFPILGRWSSRSSIFAATRRQVRTTNFNLKSMMECFSMKWSRSRIAKCRVVSENGRDLQMPEMKLMRPALEGQLEMK